jgi:hypothetical protein
MQPTYEEVEKAFSPIAQTLIDFASAHGVAVNMQPRGNGGWELKRDHPRGGQVFVLLLYDRTHGLGIGSVWQFPSPEMSLLYSHFRPMRVCEIQPGLVRAVMQDELDAILAV